MTIKVSRETICAVTGGSCESAGGSVTSEGLEFDSRSIRGGELFIALKGEVAHGHSFVSKAHERGAALFLVEDREEALNLSGANSPEPGRIIEVSDTLEAFWKLAKWWRNELGLPLIAVTGSVGKTFTKDFASALLLGHARGGFSRKSFNNHTGVPYTLCQLSTEHEWGVLELGMNHPGELTSLVQLVEPQVAVITRVAPVHLEGLGSIEAVADAKCEIIGGIRAGGTIILNADDAVLCEAAKKVIDPKKINIAYFGTAENSNCQIVSCKNNLEKGISLDLNLNGELIKLKIPVLGVHNGHNIAAAVLAARTLVPDISTESIITAAARFLPPPMRLNVRKVQGNRIIIDDSYNANPLAMRALIEVAKNFQEAGRKVGYIVGDMLELGPDSRTIHEEIAREFAETEPQFLIGVGEYGETYAKVAKDRKIMSFSAGSAEAAGHIASKIDFEVCLVKASRGVGLDKAVTVLLDTLGEVVVMPGIPDDNKPAD